MNLARIRVIPEVMINALGLPVDTQIVSVSYGLINESLVMDLVVSHNTLPRAQEAATIPLACPEIKKDSQGTRTMVSWGIKEAGK